MFVSKSLIAAYVIQSEMQRRRLWIKQVSTVKVQGSIYTHKRAVWMPEKTQKPQEQHQTTKAKKSSQLPNPLAINTEHNKPLWVSQPHSKPKSTKKHSCELMPVPETDDEEKTVKHKQRQLEKKLPAHHNAHKRPSNNKHLEQSKSEDTEDCSDTDLTHNAEESDVSDVEDPKSIMKTLSTEIPTFIMCSKAKKSLSLPVDKQSAHAHKQATETPVWPNDIISKSEESLSTKHSPASLLKSNASTLVNPSTSLSSIENASSRAHSQVPSTVKKQKLEPV
ncbi:hypothetical protein BD769DRAFT_1672070 [Suillus cothurnatus]|nr:hypothetical protein BD769DRAFT_1672070 [Suillus cothurnatus]